MAVGDFYRLAVEGSGPLAQSLVNVLYYRQDLPTIFDTATEDLCQAFQATAQTAFLAAIASGCGLTRLSARGVTDPTEGFDFSYSSPIPGGGLVGDSLPPQTAGVVTWVTGKIGRRYRGRTFFWPAIEASQADGVCTPGYIGLLAAAATELMLIGNGTTTAEYTLIVYSRTYSIGTPVTGYVVRPRLQSQRRRQLGAGS